MTEAAIRARTAIPTMEVAALDYEVYLNGKLLRAYSDFHPVVGSGCSMTVFAFNFWTQIGPFDVLTLRNRSTGEDERLEVALALISMVTIPEGEHPSDREDLQVGKMTHTNGDSFVPWRFVKIEDAYPYGFPCGDRYIRYHKWQVWGELYPKEG